MFVSAIVGVACYFSFNMVMNALVHNKKEVATPNIVGKSLYNALEELSSKGFGLKKEAEETNQNVPAGTILRQNPVAQMLVREGKIIKVTISQGGEMIYVPNLVGQTIRSADIALKHSTLVMGEVLRKFSVVTEKDIVISQDIAAGSRIDKDSVVNIVVSNGTPTEDMVLMPNFINKNIEEAKTWALQHNIILNVVNEENSSVAVGTIVKQYPKADDDITGVKSINLNVAYSRASL
jgi:serine/threonine-protein kinase